jgi:hypothetical protein
MEEAIEQLCSKISLTEREKIGISVTEGDVDIAKGYGNRCLVGKLWADKVVNKEAFKSVLSGLWRTAEGVVFKEVQDNMWLFEFADEEDKARVMAGRPWSFDRHILVLNEFNGNIPPSQMDFSRSPFWIQAHEMPLVCMTKGVGTKIGRSIGELHEVDVAGDGVGWGRCLRMRVTIDLTQPLERGRALHLDGHSHWIEFKYEKLPTFCFYCGRLVHGKQGCPERPYMHRNSDNVAKQWGVWLRADSGRRKSPVGRGEKWKTPSREEQHSDSEHSSARRPEKGSSGANRNPSWEDPNHAENLENHPEYCLTTEGNKGKSIIQKVNSEISADSYSKGARRA